MRRSATASACSPDEWCAASYYGVGRGGRRRSGCCTCMKTITVAVSATAQCADADSGGRVAASGVGGDGHGGPEHTGLHAHTDHRRAGRWCVRGGRPGAARPDQDAWRGSSSGAGTCTTRWRCSSAPRSSWCWPSRSINGVLIRGFLAGANRVFQPQNTTTRAGIVQPRQPERSGSPTSFAPWETLGFQGRNFVATGPHADELTRLNGRPAKEPIRVYVGLQHRRHRREPDGGAAERTRTHRRLRPQGAGDRPDHRHRVDQPGGRASAGDDVQRRHRDRRIAVFLSAELDFVSRRPARSRWSPAG